MRRFALAGILIATRLFGQALTSEQSRIVDAVNADAANSVTLLEQLVNINSGTLNPAGVRRVADMLRPRFEELGFACRFISMEPVQRAGHLVCERKGSQGKRVLLIGHMDTVFEPDSSFQKFARNGDTATGPGVADMKGGLVIILSALKAARAAGALDNTNITVFLTGDEERHGNPVSVARGDLIDAAKHSDAALEFEGGVRAQGHDAATIARRSSYSWTLKTAGREADSSGIFGGAGFGAIYELARILDRFRQELREDGLTYNVGLVAGGSSIAEQSGSSLTATGKNNIIPAAAQANGDIRTVTEEQYERVKKKMETIVADHLPGTTAEIEFGEGYPSMPATEGNKDLLRVLNQVNRSLGLPNMEPFDPALRGAGDLSFAAPYVASISGLGAYGGGSHAPGETIELKSQTYQTRRVALYLYELTRGTVVR
ncbi:MAG TPA: M20/M25/M40 family metallo-hydrolase [Bryobacteraceae bacterium]|nr:M20/M25/M40 family metallo-hydrolase [Bryobacteraceae bacterium]